MVAGFLGGLQVTARGFTLPFRRAPVAGNVAETLLDREFVDFGGTFVRGPGLVVAKQLAVAGLLVALVGALGVLGGALGVFLGDGLGGGELRPPAQQLLRALGGFVTR